MDTEGKEPTPQPGETIYLRDDAEQALIDSNSYFSAYVLERVDGDLDGYAFGLKEYFTVKEFLDDQLSIITDNAWESYSNSHLSLARLNRQKSVIDYAIILMNSHDAVKREITTVSEHIKIAQLMLQQIEGKSNVIRAYLADEQVKRDKEVLELTKESSRLNLRVVVLTGIMIAITIIAAFASAAQAYVGWLNYQDSHQMLISTQKIACER